MILTYFKNSDIQEKIFKYFFLFIFGIFILLAIRYQIKLLSYMEWGDESETIVAAKMIAAGSSLYSQIFNHHGPLTFLPGFFLEKIGSFGIKGHRFLILIFQIIAIFSIYFSPLLKSDFKKNTYIVGVVSVLLLFFPAMFGHMYKYQVLAGLLLVIILAQYTLPVVSEIALPLRNIVVGNILIASLPFLAVNYLPLSILLFFASLKKYFLIESFISYIVGIITNILFLTYIGSIAGFLAFHIYLNFKILPLYNSTNLDFFNLINIAFNSILSSTTQLFLFLIMLIAIYLLAVQEKNKFPWRSILILMAMGSLLIRGINFHTLPYFYSLLVFPLIFFYHYSIVGQRSRMIVSLLTLGCIIKLSLVIPADRQQLGGKKFPKTTEFSQLVQLFTEKNDRIIAYSFQNFEYIAANRLPASGYYFYLPWQEKYNENPKFGIKINPCQDIADYRPKIMLIDKWKVWDRFSWESYGSCIQKLIDEHYVQWLDRPYYLRKDLIAEGIDMTASYSSRKLQPSLPLSSSQPIPITMSSTHQRQNNGLKGIAVMFGTYNRKNSGQALLQLTGPNGSQWSEQFSLADIPDNKYRYFELDSKKYTLGKIQGITGGGVSTWESHAPEDLPYTCIQYFYTDGKRGFTPGCPLF